MDDQTERIDGLTEQIQYLTSHILDFRTEAIRRFESIEQRLDLMTSAVHSIDVRLPSLNKAISDFGATATQVIREQWKAKDLTTDLADRLTRLEEQVSKLIKPAA
jgi:DNA repair ATPase RecN